MQEIDRGRAEKEKLPIAASLAPPAVDQAAKDCEEAGQTMNFIQYDELIFMLAKVKLRVGEPGTIGWKLEVQI